MRRKQPLSGLCQTKCPKREIDFRIKNRLLHPLECEQPFDKIAQRNRHPIPERLCKVYSRPAANRTIQMEDVRTVSALKEAVDYLLEVEQEFPSDAQWSLVYEFIADRFRSVRQDYIVQQLSNVYLFEQMIFFYIRARYRSERLNTPTYNSALHSRELDECLKEWACFDDVKSEEVRILYVLYSIPIHYNPNIFGLLRCQREFISEDTYKSLWSLVEAYSIQNFIKFFRIVSKTFTDGPRREILMPVIREMRIRAFEALFASNRSPICSIPIDNIQKWLLFADELALKKCVDECFETSPLNEKAFRCYGSKLKPSDSIKFSFEWVSIK